jgi:hypothetical protein
MWEHCSGRAKYKMSHKMLSVTFEDDRVTDFIYHETK